MAHWLLKSDPETYSFDDLVRDGTTVWDGIRNHQARIHLAAMKAGDECLMYHSGKEPGIVGTAKVARAAYRDPKADDPRWLNVDLKSGKRLRRAVSLAEVKKHPALKSMAVVRQSRLSVSPVTDAEWKAVVALGASAS
jgi:predicted RNA-binding protein with PUA-like domain